MSANTAQTSTPSQLIIRGIIRNSCAVGEMRSIGKNRREETVISRLRFRHIGLNSTLFCSKEQETTHFIALSEV